jgi:fimbrial isopeptide formation D2 family protein
MFKKLLSNLPFNPSLLDQVSFYYGRLKKETAIRRLGFVLMVGAMAIQFIATIAPPQQSLAYSPNDVLNGISNKNDILKAWDANTNNVREIYSRYGITRDNISAIKGQSPNDTVSSGGDKYWSIGRLPLDNFGISSEDWGERSVDITSKLTVYERPLHAWDTHGSSSYEAYHGRNSHGVDFWILKTCGNPTFEGDYLPNPPKPKVEIHKTLLTSNVVHRGDIVKFRLEYRNSKKDSLAKHFKLRDTLDNNFEFVSLDGGMNYHSGNTVGVDYKGPVGYTATSRIRTLVVRVRDSAANQSTICNTATVSSDEDSDTSEKPCVTVVVPSMPAPPPPPPVSTPTPQITTVSPAAPTGYCIASSSFISGSNRDFNVRTETYVQPGTQINSYSFIASTATYEKKFTGLANGAHTILVYVDFKSATGQTAQTKACQAQITIAEDARVVLSKSVANITKGGDANNTTVGNGDVLEFKLVTQNVTSTNYMNYNGEDYLGGVLQYADIADSSQIALQDMKLDSQNYLRWKIPNLAAGTSDVKTLRVKVKDPIPVTNTPSKLSPDYSCSIINNYGSQVAMNINCPVAKSVEQTTKSLPNTGPGTTLTIAAAIASLAGYLFSRSRIMARELLLVRDEYLSSGGF